MKRILNEWRAYLSEARENNFNHNVDKIILAFQSSPDHIDTTQFYYEFKDRNDFEDFLMLSGAYKILATYKINKLLGHGAIGFAFALEEPHKDYILKFQISDRTYGADYIKDVYSRQQQGEFKPNEVRVLEAFEQKEKFGATTALFCVFVMSKVSMENIGGKTGKTITSDDAYFDMEDSFAINVIENLIALNTLYGRSDKDSPDVQKAIKNTKKAGSMSTGTKSAEYKKIINIFENSTIENVAKYLYGLKTNFINHLSRDQYVAMFKEIYDQGKASVKAGRTMDLHGGNFGFRPKSDTPISFDI